ncbi:hypothetical protein CBR_g286 [Chara braunii]|uniref:Uncharacterized protein n=1 Tax=Chara braunii TaxID=69332 RepID=A0A388JQH0_CHABU|nr:hypothetical protein CBR_g286 [Chara braunii]|eukprot:GBG59952.1 hypothetical protein CBR_g286 [Chara braunii]
MLSIGLCGMNVAAHAVKCMYAVATWPGLCHALCTCIWVEVQSSKKKVPDNMLARTFKKFIQKAEDRSCGRRGFLARKIKSIFQHMYEIIRGVPIFGSDYGTVLRQLIAVSEYRLRMPKRIYGELLHLYTEKVLEMVHTKSTRTEEGFRNALTMFTLLQNPPGDFPDSLRDETVDMFCQIFERLRDEGRIAEKLVAALNAFLLNQGLNLGDGVASIHASFRDFMVRAWLTTHDRKLKEGLVLYGRLQARLRGVVLLKDEGAIEELLDLVEKELDLSGASALGGSSYRSEDGELGTASKRRKKESLFLRMKEKLLAGKGPW